MKNMLNILTVVNPIMEVDWDTSIQPKINNICGITEASVSEIEEHSSTLARIFYLHTKHVTDVKHEKLLGHPGQHL